MEGDIEAWIVLPDGVSDICRAGRELLTVQSEVPQRVLIGESENLAAPRPHGFRCQQPPGARFVVSVIRLLNSRQGRGLGFW